MWFNAKDLEDEQSQPIQRELLHHPDGTIVQVKGTDRKRIKKGSFVRVIILPTDFYLEESSWRHLAIQVVPNRTGDWRVLLFTAAAALIASLVAGLFSAREALRQGLAAGLGSVRGSGGWEAGRLHNSWIDPSSDPGG